jgi:hypothetical protein
MALAKIVSATLGLSTPWQVSKMTFADGNRRLDITIVYDDGEGTVCPCCGTSGTTCEAEPETWYHHDFLRYATYLHTRVPTFICCGRRHAVERPWARTGSKFIKISEAGQQ